MLFRIWKSYKFLQFSFELCIDGLLVPSSCSAEHLGKVKGSNFSGNNSNEILEYIERPVIYTSCGEILCQGNTDGEKCISFVTVRVTGTASEDVLLLQCAPCIDFTLEIGFSKKVCAHRKTKTSFTDQACSVNLHSLDCQTFEEKSRYIPLPKHHCS